MNLFVLTCVLAVLMVILLLLNVWQRKIGVLERERIVGSIRDAESLGTTQALTQHPQIDEQSCIGCGTCIASCPEDDVLGLVDGIARVIHGSRCIGHARCAEVCPVGAIQIGLGDLSGRTDIPALSPDLESSAEGVFIAGELSGFALIRIAVEQGTRVIDSIVSDFADAPNTRPDEVHDVLIVGAGPAGLAASLRATEKGLSYVTIDQEDIGGTVRKYPRRKLVLIGGTLELPLCGKIKKTEFLKEELIDFWETLIHEHHVPFHAGVKFTGARRESDYFVAETSAGSIAARRIVLALGRRGSPRKLDVPGEEQEKVLYQLVDAATYQGEHILVVGGGDSAIETATGLANQRGNVVTLSYRKDNFFRLKSRNEDRIREFIDEGRIKVIFGSTVRSVDETSVTLNTEVNGVSKALELRNDYVFVHAGGEPPYPLLAGLGVRFSGDEADESLAQIDPGARES